MDSNINTRLRAFQEEHNAFTKGPLSLLVQLTRIFAQKLFR